MKELDFLPASFHETRRHACVRRRNALYALGVAIGLGCLHFVGASQVSRAEAKLATLHREDHERGLRQSQIQSLQTRKSALAGRLALLDRLDDDAPVDAVLAEITRLMPGPTALRSIHLEVTRAADPGDDKTSRVFDRGPTLISLQGIAASDMAVGIFFGRLAECPLFEDVELIISRQAEAGPMREFEIAFKVRPVAIEP